MSRVLRFVLVDFQAFPTIPGNSTRHAHDMELLPPASGGAPGRNSNPFGQSVRPDSIRLVACGAHTLDTIIWQLAGVDAEAGACITSQISGAYNRYKAIVALLILHERNTQKKTAELTKEARRLMERMNLPADQRNRHVHDPWSLRGLPIARLAGRLSVEASRSSFKIRSSLGGRP